MNSFLIRLMFLLVCGIFPSYSFCQKDSVTMYFDTNGDLCEKANAFYIAKGVRDNNGVRLSFFIILTNTRVMESGYTDTTLSVKNGHFVLYEDDGVRLIKKGHYTDNKEDGYWLSWKDRLTDSTYYEQGVAIRKVSFTYHGESGKIASRTVDDTRNNKGETLCWDTSGLLVSKTLRINSDEETHFYYTNGKIKEIERRPFGQQPSSKYYSQSGKDITKQILKEKEQNEEILSDWPTGGDKPAFPGGRKEFFDFIFRNLKFSPGYTNTVYVGRSTMINISFMLDHAGNAKDITVKGVVHDMEVEVISLIRRMPSWKMNGLKSYGPIRFSINIAHIY